MTNHSEQRMAEGLSDGIVGPTGAELDELRRRLTQRADAEGVLDITYRVLDSPFGPILVAVTAAGVLRVAFGSEDHDAVLSALASGVSPRILEGGRRTEPVVAQLEEYFAGQRRSFDLPLDLRLVTGFRRQVISQLPAIPYGSTATYAAVAARAGNPKAVRAVGSACARNPLPLVIPCHRVVRSDGSTGQYLGGPTVKAALLDLEAAR